MHKQDVVSAHVQYYQLQYSQKYWRSLNLAVLPQTTFLTLLTDLNLAVERHTTKLPNFRAIRYLLVLFIQSVSCTVLRTLNRCKVHTFVHLVLEHVYCADILGGSSNRVHREASGEPPGLYQTNTTDHRTPSAHARVGNDDCATRANIQLSF